MRDVRGSIARFEVMAARNTIVHRLHPAVKILSTLAFIVTTVTYGRYDLVRLAPLLFYPFIIAPLSETPIKPLFFAVLPALPFCLFAGFTNVFFERETAIVIFDLNVSYGVVSLATILLKMLLCAVSAALLVATTPLFDILAQLRRFRVPSLFVDMFGLVYRYVGIIGEETRTMIIAYRLRRGSDRSLDMKHMGAFVGLLLLRGFDRAERVRAALACRGYDGDALSMRLTRPFDIKNAVAVVGFCCILAVIRIWG